MRLGSWRAAPLRWGIVWGGLIGNVVCLAKPCFANGEAQLPLDYQAEASCPERDAFLGLIAERTASSGTTGAPRARVSVRLNRAGDSFVGRLDLERYDGTAYRRDVAGATCAEVANALSFVLALALSDKDANGSEAAPVASPSVPPPAQSASPPPVRATPKPAPTLRSKSPWRLTGGAQFGVRSGLGPNWTTLETAFVDARRVSSTPLSLSLRASFAHSQNVGNAVSDFSWNAGRLEACPVLIRAFEPVSIAPCLAAHVGLLHAVGHPGGNGQGRRVSRAWLDGLVALRVEARLLRGLSLQLQGELIVPFTPYEFGFAGSGAVVYRVPNGAAASLLGLAVQFP